jgi:cytochrome P450
VITETLRVRPAIPWTTRIVVNQPFALGGYEIDVGTLIAPCMYLVQRRPDLYPEPEQLRPERFLGKPVDPYAWCPFGGGRHHCIGRSFATTEIKMILNVVASQARLEPADQADEQIMRRGVIFSPSRTAASCCASAWRRPQPSGQLDAKVTPPGHAPARGRAVRASAAPGRWS